MVRFLRLSSPIEPVEGLVRNKEFSTGLRHTDRFEGWARDGRFMQIDAESVVDDTKFDGSIALRGQV